MAIDTNLTYMLSGHFKVESNSFNGIVFGFVLADAEQRIIRSFNVFSEKGTRTELAAACRFGDRIIRVRDASVWKTGEKYAAAFGVGENEYTTNVTKCGITEVRPDNGEWLVVLNTPCGVVMPAGTPVVQNRTGNGGIFLPQSMKTKIGSEWTEIKGRIGPKQWWPGTAYARVVVLGSELRRAARAPDPPTLLMDDFSLQIVE